MIFGEKFISAKVESAKFVFGENGNYRKIYLTYLFTNDNEVNKRASYTFTGNNKHILQEQETEYIINSFESFFISFENISNI
jgi:hypothetical protein